MAELSDRSKAFLDGVDIGRNIGMRDVEMILLRTFEQAMFDKDDDLKDRCLNALSIIREVCPDMDHSA